MKSLLFSLTLSLLGTIGLWAQNTTTVDNPDLPYYEIPDYPESYNPGTVAARMIDGLGFRYYWGTEGLTENDLNYKPSEDGRTAAETLDHIYGLSRTIINAAMKKPNIRTEPETLTFAEKRQKTLENFKTASDLLKANGEGGLEEFKVIFQRGEQSSEFPFWNMINGPIADAIYHVGQIVSHRRASGTPLDPRVSVFSGTLRK